MFGRLRELHIPCRRKGGATDANDARLNGMLRPMLLAGRHLGSNQPEALRRNQPLWVWCSINDSKADVVLSSDTLQTCSANGFGWRS